MITAESEDRAVTRNSSFFKSLNQPATDSDKEFRSSGLGSPAYKGCTQELPAVTPSLNAPDPVPQKLVNTPHTILPNSSNPVPVPEGQIRSSHPDGQPPLRRSTRNRTPRKILDL